MITAQQLREKYTKFFASKGHTIIQTAPLVPENDPTVLFTTAGMHPLVPFIMGEPHPGGVRLTNYQKCIRTADIDEVGDASHLTFFEMLGNWSLGDYFKKEAITWSFEFLTKELGIPLKMLAFTCFGGDDREPSLPRDEEAFEIWKSVGAPESRIAFVKGGVYESTNNWWGPAGQTGPCGPDTEMFYWVGEGEPPETFDPEDKRWLEIWNDVLMQYKKTSDGKYIPLEKKTIDTGMGLERTLCVLTGQKSVYDTELFAPLMTKIKELSNSRPSEQTNPQPQLSDLDLTKSTRIIADHIRSAVFMASDHVRPSNMDQGYVMRRIIRRAIRHGKKIGIHGQFLDQLAKTVIDQYGEVYPSLQKYEKQIIEALFDEEEQFQKTLEKGMREFEKLVTQLQSESRSQVTGQEAFHLYDTYGFPIEMTKDLAEESNLTVDLKGFEESFKKHQDLSRTASAGQFKGGLADHSAETTRLHTATHLLQQALRTVLGTHVEQRGSNVTKDRTRFDFSHPQKMSPEEIAKVESLVNSAIDSAHPVHYEIMTFEEAKKRGAIGLFEDRYQEKIKVYFMGDFSTEVCGGPHVENTSELSKSGKFKIKKEEASSAGVRRIKAVLES